MNKSLKALLTINSIFVFGASLLGPLYAVYVKEIGGDILTIGWTFSVYMFTGGIVSYFSGRFGDKIKDTKLLVAAGYLIRTAGFLLYTVIGNPTQLLLIQLLLGTGEAIANPAFKAIFSSHLDKNKYSTQWGVWDLVHSIVVGAAVGAGAFIIQFFGFDVLFYIMSSLSGLAFVIMMFQPSNLLYKRKD